MYDVEMVELDSSNIKAVGYDAENRRMVVEFLSGGTYRYDDVPPSVFVGLISDDSPGGFFAREVKGKYPFVKVGGKDNDDMWKLVERLRSTNERFIFQGGSPLARVLADELEKQAKLITELQILLMLKEKRGKDNE